MVLVLDFSLLVSEYAGFLSNYFSFVDWLSLASLILYLIFLVSGGVTIGYLVLRFTHPDVRMASSETRLGASAIIGGLIIALAALGDYFLFDSVIVSGFFPIMVLSVFFSFFVLFKLLFVFFPFRYLIIGVPVARTGTKSLNERVLKLRDEIAPIALENSTSPISKASLKKESSLAEEKKTFVEGKDNLPRYRQARGEPKGSSQLNEVISRKEDVEKTLKKAMETELDAEVESILKEVKVEPLNKQQDVFKEDKSKPVHRLYLVPDEEREKEVSSSKVVKVVAPRDIAERKEFDSLINDVYSQLKESSPQEKKEVLEKKRLDKGRRQEVSSQSQGKELSLEEVLGIKKETDSTNQEENKQQPTPLFQKLEESMSSKPVEEHSVEFMKIEASKDLSCPTCKSKLSRIVFCPYCSKGMCANCSPSIKTEDSFFIYTCPNCGEEVTVRKKKA